MTNVTALKKFAAAYIGGITPDEVPGNTVADVIEYLAKFQAGEILGTLTVTSTAGTSEGKTKLSVTPSLKSGNSYVYSTSPTKIATPEYLDDASGYTAWNGTAEITAEDGHFIAVYEVDSKKQILKFGQVKAKINLG